MKLEVGMYVRIKNKAGWCCIGTIHNINDFREPSVKYCIDIQSDDFVFIPEDMIAKASYNIIDLIELGDYVNGEKVILTQDYAVTKKGRCLIQTDAYDINDDEQYLIKSIVTKEQFEQMQYRVGE